MIERIKKVISVKAKSPREFALLIDFNYSTLNNYLNGRRKSIDSEMLSKIVSTFDDISANWLLTGKGSMIESLANEMLEVNDKYCKLLEENAELYKKYVSVLEELKQVNDEKNIPAKRGCGAMDVEMETGS